MLAVLLQFMNCLRENETEALSDACMHVRRGIENNYARLDLDNVNSSRSLTASLSPAHAQPQLCVEEAFNSQRIL